MTTIQSVISHELFEAFFSAAPMPCAVVDKEAVMLRCNAAWTSALGFAVEELQYLQLVDLLHEDDLAVVYQLFKPVSTTIELPHRFLHRDGSWRWFKCTMTPFPDGDKFCLFLADVTALTAAQDALSRRDALLGQIEKLAHVGAWEGTLESDEITWTDNLFHLYEMPVGPVPYHDYTLRSFDFDDSQRLSAAIGECHQHGTPWNLVLRMTTAKGNRRWVRSVGNLGLRDGRPYSIFGVMQDISEQIELEHELRNVSTRLSGLLSIASDQNLPYRAKLEAILELGCSALQLPLGVVNQVENNNCEIAAAWSAERKIDFGDRIALEGTFTEAVIAHGGVLACHEVARSALAALPSYRLLRFEAYVGMPLIIDGVAVGTLMFASTVSSRTAFTEPEIQLVELIGQVISHEVARKRAQLALRRLKDEAEVASRAKTQFLAQMSHELRTPLNSIVGYTRRLLKGQHTSMSERELDALRIVQRNGEQLAHLVDDLLDLSIIEQGKLNLRKEPCDIADLLKELIGEHQQAAAGKNLRLFAMIAPEHLQISVDVPRFRQIITNLLSNAIKFTERGEIEVSLHEDVEKRRIEIRVRDTGIGIAREDRARLFRKFERASEHYLGAIGGVGLGLALVWELVAMHGGTTHVDSEPGVGSCFTIRLPLS